MDDKVTTTKPRWLRWSNIRAREGGRVIEAAHLFRRQVEVRRPEPTPPAAPGRRAS